ncbi:MAG: M15 family metallopeptidase [Gemmatimonadaceae bacterium]
MSAGTSSVQVMQTLDVLAPKFRDAVSKAIADCNANGLDAIVYESYRSQELQANYYARGRTVIPPHDTVTNAQSNLYSWHGYGLAVDVISRSKEWDQPESWFASIAEYFRAAGCRWGGEWKMKDLPHFQWAACKPSPSDTARSLLASGGMRAVWEAVGAI